MSDRVKRIRARQEAPVPDGTEVTWTHCGGELSPESAEAMDTIARAAAETMR